MARPLRIEVSGGLFHGVEGTGLAFHQVCYFPAMTRQTRIHLAGLPLHIVQRGHNREAGFFGDEGAIAEPRGLSRMNHHRTGQA